VPAVPAAPDAAAQRPPRYLVGIDLGTTHTVVAYTDLRAPGRPSPEIFPLEQLVSASEHAPRPLLASCLYVPFPGEIPGSAATLGVDPPYLAGEYARRRGAEAAGRVVQSAKSWLCHPGVDRTEAILPWGNTQEPSGAGAGAGAGVDGEAPPVPPISPVDASAQYLKHVRRAWDAAFPGAPLAEQDVVLTVPASFDEAARELTIEATRRAGLAVRLLEEPQAAFYDWMSRRGDEGLAALLGGRGSTTVLVCDVGGGTTDLSLIRVDAGQGATGGQAGRAGRAGDDALRVTRIAVGDHLLLGGDNMDLALAHACEPRLTGGGARLSPARFGQLVSACRAAKESLLGAEPPEQATITLLGQGARLLGAASRVELTREEAERLVLDGFFPEVPLSSRPERARSALVSFGLPYARDTAITRHLAAFLARHGEGGRPALPDALVLNGGVFHARAVAERLSFVMTRWTGMAPRLLPYADPDLAVARGAVAYGLALRGQGRRIEGGSSRAYYVGVGGGVGAGAGRSDAAQPPERAVCVVPRGSDEGVRFRPPQRLMLTVGRPARFELFASSDDRGHLLGDLIEIAPEDDEFHRLPPIFATLPAEGGGGELPVALEGELTPIGTLDLACVELERPGRAGAQAGRRFRLAFRLRAGDAPPASMRVAPASVRPLAAGSIRPPPGSIRPPPSLGGKRLDEASGLMLRVFGKSKEPATPREVKDLIRDLERLMGERPTWTTDVSRTLFDLLLPSARGRRRSAEHERMFWSLAGYTLRPGFGHPADAARVAQLFPLFHEGITHPRDARVWQQFWIAWRRASGGLPEAAQVEVRDAGDAHLDPEATRARGKGPRAEALDDLLSLSTWLERVPPARRAQLGGWIVERMWTDKDARLREGLGRVGARVPAYASAHYAVASDVAEAWLEELMRDKWTEVASAPQAAFRLARLTGDRARDVSERMRREVIKRLQAAAANPTWILALTEVVPTSDAEQAEVWGESLPVGLRLAGGE
jgi:molecular chaperone DnaK (HSP70)